MGQHKKAVRTRETVWLVHNHGIAKPDANYRISLKSAEPDFDTQVTELDMRIRAVFDESRFDVFRGEVSL